jgi:uncharacterized membrane protein
MRQLDTPPTPSTAPSLAPAYQRIITIVLRPAVALPLVTLLALLLRLYKLNYYDYFDDEVITTFVARQSAAEIFRNVMVNDSHPPFYHILLHFWRAGFGESLVALRLFSVVTSVACVPLTYMLGRMIASRPAALVAAALMAIAPFQIYHSQQARMYPLLTLIVLVTTLVFFQAWQRGGWLRWLGFGLCVTAGLYTHVYFPLSLLALDLWALYETYIHRRIDRSRWVGLIIAHILAALAFLPFLPTMLGTVRMVVQTFWIEPNSPFDWMFDLVSLANNATLASLPDFEAPAWYLVCTYLPAVAVLIPALVYSIREARRRPKERSAWVLLHLLIWTPIVVATIISLTIRPILLDRSLIGLSPALFLIMGWMFVRFWKKRSAQLLALFFVASCLASLAYAFPDAPISNGLIGMANYLAREARPGDAIAYTDWQSFDSAALAQPQQPDVYVLPFTDASNAIWLARMQVMHWREPHQVESIPAFGAHYRRIWLVYSLFTYGLDYHKQVDQSWLEQHGQRVDRVVFDRAVLLLYEVTH